MQAIGLASRDTVPDSSFSATSEYNNLYKAFNGRLNGTSAWVPSGKNNANDYLQIDLGYEFIICAVATQGNGKGLPEWTTKYKIQLSLNHTSFVTYKENNTDKVGFISLQEKYCKYYNAHFHVKENTSSVDVWDCG